MGKTDPYQALRNKLYAFLKDSRCEGSPPWLYLDKNCLLHTGIGFNLDPSGDPSTPTESKVSMYLSKYKGRVDAKEKALADAVKNDKLRQGPAYRFAWSKKKGGRANKDDIYKAVWTVRYLKLRNLVTCDGKSAPFKNKTDLVLTANELRKKFDEWANYRINALKICFPEFDKYPADARLAMIVHAWALWPKKTSKGLIVFRGKPWPNYTKACQKRIWWSSDPNAITAAKESHWRNMSAYRYQEMVKMFKNAQAVEDGLKKGERIDLNTLHWNP